MVCDFITKTTGKNTPSAPLPPEKLQREFQYHFRELEFMCQAVQLAISISQIQGTNVQSMAESISPSALLKASHRIAEMMNKGGDMCVCEGILVWRRKCRAGEPWERYYSEECRIKVISDLAKMSKTCFSVRIDRIFLGSVDEVPADEGSGAHGDAINFSINVATSMRLESAANISEATAAATGDESLGWRDGQAVLIWPGIPSSATLDPEFDSILLESSTISPRDCRIGLANPEDLSEFAFYFKERRPGDTAFSPVDFLYVAKLCALDDHAEGTLTTAADGAPPHLKAADEVLREILRPPTPLRKEDQDTDGSFRTASCKADGEKSSRSKHGNSSNRKR
eukprot:GEMP01035229.1.p1 GENE.GEMP01035229.1~~GEMP01035229.1.p1  ORF type:complete len:340 (+),score=71.93 GEMP01035229.1:303-1322(+)